MNESINESINITQESLGGNANEIILNYFSTASGIPLGESIVFWIVMGIFGFIIYTLLSMLTDFSKSIIIMFSLLPLLLFDSLMSFGIYIFHLPFFGSYEIERLVMTFGFVDWIFGFQLFNPALDIMSSYTVAEGNPLTTHLSFGSIIDLIWNVSLLPLSILAITALISIGDSALQFIIFFMATYYALSIIEDKWERQFSLQVPVSIIIGAFPVLLYAFYFSNPIHEFEKANVQIASLIHFMSVAPLIDIIIVLGLGAVSFFFVLIVMSILTKTFMSSSIAVFPSMQEKQWKTNYASVAFITTLLYSFLYVMHPEYQWYLIIGVILVWKIFRHLMEDISHEAKGRTREREGRRKEIAMIVHEVQNPTHEERRSPQEGSTFFTIEIILTIIGLVILFIGMISFMGIL